jgi:hypothetical protein
VCLKGQKEIKYDVSVLRILKIYKSDAESVRFGVFTALMWSGASQTIAGMPLNEM